MRGTCSLTGGMLLVLILAASMFHGTGLVGADDPSYVKVQIVVCLDGSGSPIANTTTWFEVVSGLHEGQRGSAVTDASGEASWSYAGTSIGQDTIVATTSTLVSNEVTITWYGSPIPSPRNAAAFPSIYVGIAAAMVAGILAYLARSRFARTAQLLEQRMRD